MKTTRIAAILLGAAALSGVGLAGCGSDSSSSAPADTAAAETAAADTTASAALTSEELVSQANAICAKANADEQALKEQPAPTDLAGLQQLVADGQAISEKASSDLQALTPPEELATDYQAFLDNLGTSVTVGARLVDEAQAAETADELGAAAKAASADLQDAKATNDELSTKIGLTECVSQSAS